MEQFQAKESSNVGWARYFPDSGTLEIDFKAGKGNSVSKSTYEYKGFPAETWREFQGSASKGRFFAENIRPKYKGVKIKQPGAGTLDFNEPTDTTIPG